MLDYIRQRPLSRFVVSEISEQLKMKRSETLYLLTYFARTGVLIREDKFKGGEVVSQASANSLTHLLYNTVLKPAWDSAITLKPYDIEVEDLDRKLKFFLSNYGEEKSNRGEKGGSELRDTIIEVLNEKAGMKLSHVRQEVNRRTGRNLTEGAFTHQINKLRKRGLVVKRKAIIGLK